MNGMSYTTVIGYARILVIMGGFALVATKQMTLLDATAAVTFFLGVLGSVGFFAAKDASAPDAQINVKQVGDQITMKATAEDASKKDD